MSALPARFPRASLIRQAADLDYRLELLAGQTALKAQEAADRGLDTAHLKLQARYIQLDRCREIANQLRAVIWDLQ